MPASDRGGFRDASISCNFPTLRTRASRSARRDYARPLFSAHERRTSHGARHLQVNPSQPAHPLDCDTKAIEAERRRVQGSEQQHQWSLQPSGLVHADVKKKGWIPPGGRWRAHGLQMGSNVEYRRTKIGYEFVYPTVHDDSQLA